MYPLSFAEFMSVCKDEKYEGLSEYMFYGGIQLVVLREGANEKVAAMQNLFDEIYITETGSRRQSGMHPRFGNGGSVYCHSSCTYP